MYDPDFRGDKYFRTFAEQRTGYAKLTFSKTKSCADLLKDLEYMRQ